MSYVTQAVKLIHDGLQACMHRQVRHLTARPRRHLEKASPSLSPWSLPNHRHRLYSAYATGRDGDSTLKEYNDALSKRRSASGAAAELSPTDHLSSSEHDSQKKRRDAERWHKRWELSPHLVLGTKQWDAASKDDLFEILKELSKKSHFKETYDLARYMITQRGISPTLGTFGFLIESNTSIHGSVAEVLDLLEQTHAEQIPLDTMICHKILKVLAVHPDYLLRTEILLFMEEHWQGLTESDQHWVVAGMLRELQLERALEALETMLRSGVQIQTWLYELTAYILTSLEEFEEALRVVNMRIDDKGPEKLTVLWTYLLDSAAEALHYETCLHVWRRMIDPRYIIPSSGTCLRVLNTAARHGDVVLARDVFQSLFERSSNLDEQHYEMVAEAYANSGDMDGALGVVCEMSTAKMVIDKSTTRPIFRAFENHDPTPLSRILHEAFEGLSKLEQRHVKVPIVAINVLIELGAAAFLPGQDRRLSEVAFSIYDRLRMVCHDGPNIDTYCLMFDICRRFGRMDKIPELVNEITQMKQIKPDLQFFDTLILTYLYHMDETAAATGQVLLTSTESFQAAFQYYGETKRRGLRPSRRVVSRIYKILLHANDRRASEVLRDVKRWAAQDDTWGKLERKQWKVGIGEETEESDEELEDALPAKRAGPENAAAEGLNL